MRLVGSTISKLYLFVIHNAAVESKGDIDEFFRSIHTNAEDFKKWCDAVTRAHKRPMSYDILTKLTKEELEQNYFPKRSYPLQKKLSDIHNILYIQKGIRSNLTEFGFYYHHDFYKALACIPIGDRYLTHADLYHINPETLRSMVGQVDDEELTVDEQPQEDLSRINLSLMKSFMNHFKSHEVVVKVSTLAPYLKVKHETLQKYFGRFRDKDGNSLDLTVLETCSLQQLQERFVKIDEHPWKGKGKERDQFEEVEEEASQAVGGRFSIGAADGIRGNKFQKRKNSDDFPNPSGAKSGNFSEKKSHVQQKVFTHQPQPLQPLQSQASNFHTFFASGNPVVVPTPSPAPIPEQNIIHDVVTGMSYERSTGRMFDTHRGLIFCSLTGNIYNTITGAVERLMDVAGTNSEPPNFTYK